MSNPFPLILNPSPPNNKTSPWLHIATILEGFYIGGLGGLVLGGKGLLGTTKMIALVVEGLPLLTPPCSGDPPAKAAGGTFKSEKKVEQAKAAVAKCIERLGEESLRASLLGHCVKSPHL